MGGEGAIKTAQLNDVENTIVVAVGKNVKEGKSILLWAMERFPEWKMCLLHVHQPSQLLTLMDGKLPASKLKRHAIKAYQELERQKVNKLLDQYLFVLAEGGVQACKMWIELDNVEKGIVEFITRHGIRWLVMGAASEKHYSRRCETAVSFVVFSFEIQMHYMWRCSSSIRIRLLVSSYHKRVDRTQVK